MSKRGTLVRFLPASDTRERWYEKNPVPLKGEICVEIDTQRWKFGDGERGYRDLPYAQPDYTKEFFEIMSLGAEIQVILNAESNRVASESTRQTQETQRQQLYAQLLDILEQLESEPAIELASQIAEIRASARTLSHLSDSGKDLVAIDGVLYRVRHTIEGGEPWVRHIEVGKKLVNDYISTVAPGTANRMRLYWKQQGQSTIHVLVHCGDIEANKYAAELDNYTKHYSAVFDLTETREVILSSYPAWGDEVMVWDLDWKEEAYAD